MKVLIADDDDAIRLLLKTCLRTWGYEVVEVANGREAWQALQADDTPRLIILDWGMPEIDGIELCQKLRQQPDMPYIYVVILTGMGHEADVVHALNSGADDYVRKPFNPDELKSRVAVGARIVQYEEMLADKGEQLRLKINELAASKASFRNIVQKSVDAIMVIDEARVVRFVNPAAESVFGCKASEILGKPTVFPVGPDISTEIGLAGGGTGEMRVVETRWEGQPAYLAVVRDVTARKRMAEELRRAKEDAEAATEAKSQFLANTSHELRTPLNSIIGFANVLLKNKRGNLQEKDVDFLQRIRNSGKHLLGLINQILDLSRIEAGHLDLQIRPFALDELIAEVMNEFEGQLSGKTVELVQDVPAGLPTILADPERMKEVLVNLIGNALKFTPKGRVCVSVQTDAASGRPLRVAVADTGIGIPRDRLEKIFEAFQQADTSTSRQYGGSGLGLTIARSLLGCMDCGLQVESEEGRGSTFTIVLGARTCPGRSEAGQRGGATS
ncbi:MAG: response regulator [Kiritimatiellae bacterium]|nr:response regulator [Kiritimatiellia bacterium]